MMVLGLQLRHNALRHTFGLLLTIALGCLGWFCWKRTREAARLRRGGGDPLRISSSVASPSPPIAISIATNPNPNPTSSPPLAPPLPPLPFRPFKPASDSASSPDASDLPPIKNSDCPICLSAFEIDSLLTVLPSCHHAYHPPCIHQWLQSHKDCPICRAQIPHL